MNLLSRQSMNSHITDSLKKTGFSVCSTFNARNSYVVIDNSPSHLYSWINQDLEFKGGSYEENIRFIARKLLIPFSPVFPFFEGESMQKSVFECLTEIGCSNKKLEYELRTEMNLQTIERRNMKEKHVPDLNTRTFLDENRRPSSVRFLS